MMADVVIFGIGDYAEQAHYYLSTDSPHRVVGFSVTSEWRKESRFHDLPLVPFEEIDKAFPPSEVSFFLPMSGRRMNRDRERFYKEAKSKGYSLISYVSSRAILCDNKIGENCFIFEGANLQPFAEVGDDSIVWCQTHVGHHSLIGDHVFISAGVTVSGRCRIGPYCYLSAHALIDANVTLAEGTLAALASVITRDTTPWGIYTGQPARRRKVSSADFNFL
jgi:sugar O-acyltransferase (sialic acid O-acetyltransferase NeuD family)